MPTGRDADKAQIRDMVQEGRLEVGEAVIVKRLTSVNPGDPTKGIGPTYSFQLTPSRAVIQAVDQNDLMYAGGLYQVGDIKCQLNEELREVSDKSGSIGDRLIWRGSEYRLVGKKHPAVLGSRTLFFEYVMRKVET